MGYAIGTFLGLFYIFASLSIGYALLGLAVFVALCTSIAWVSGGKVYKTFKWSSIIGIVLIVIFYVLVTLNGTAGLS